jgi:hypothetical protein
LFVGQAVDLRGSPLDDRMALPIGALRPLAQRAVEAADRVAPRPLEQKGEDAMDEAG